MRICEVKLENFRKVEYAHLAFKDGIIVFSGDNGEGKSTFLQAISMVLYNHFPQSLKEYVRWGSDAFTVIVEFEYLGKCYETTLTYHLKKESSRTLKEIRVANGVEIDSTSGVVQFLAELLDPRRAVASTIAFEHEVDLIKTTPAERREYLKKIFDFDFKEQIDVVDALLDQATADSHTLRSEINLLKDYRFDLHPLEPLPFSQEQFDAYTKEKEQISDKIQEVRGAISSLEKKKEELVSLKEELTKAKGNRVDATECIEAKESQLAIQKDQLSSLSGDIDVSDIESKYQKLKWDLQTDIDTLTQLQKDMKESLEKPLEGRDKDLIDKEGLDLKSKVSVLRSDFARKQKEYEQLKEGICPLCNHEITPSEQEHLKTELQEISDTIIQHESRLEELREERKARVEQEKLVQIQQSKFDEVEKKLFIVTTEFNSLSDKEKQEILHKQKEIQQKKEYLEGSVKTIEQAIQEKKKLLYEYILPQIEKVEKSIATFTNEVESVDALIEERNKLHLALQDVQYKLEKYQTVISQNQTKEEFNKKLQEDEKNRDIKVKKKSEELATKENSITQFELEKKILSKELPSFIISRKVGELKKYVNEFLNKVYPKYAITVKETRNALSIYYGETEADVRTASGFEKQIFSFAYKYALGKMQNYGILFLDEVDSSASDANSRKFYDTLGNMGDHFDQIFVISHKEEAKELLLNDFSAQVFSVENGQYVLQ